MQSGRDYTLLPKISDLKHVCVERVAANDTTTHDKGPRGIKTIHHMFGLSSDVRGGLGRVPQWSRGLQDYIVSTGPHLH